MNCLLPLLFLIVPDLKNPAERITIPADASYKKSVMQSESEWKGHVKRFWIDGAAHKFCQKAGRHCAAGVFVTPNEIHVGCVTTSEAEAK